MLGIYIRTSKEGTKDESPIEQQKREGVSFAVKNDYRYEIYEDRGISGFRITDDETDPFKNRPGFMSLIGDIKSKKVDSVWVWEHSRLSRNQFASAIIFNLFEKNEVKVFEKDKEFAYTDPQAKMIRGLLDIMSEYERSLITGIFLSLLRFVRLVILKTLFLHSQMPLFSLTFLAYIIYSEGDEELIHIKF
jgi:DNA invertase Pin-like site-specific DNA recombinase